MSLRKPLNRLLRRFGYELTRYDMFADFLAETFQPGAEFSFIQIGANDGIKFDRLYGFVAQQKSRGIVVEPLGLYFGRLKENYSRFPDIIPVNVAIHATQSTAHIHYVDPDRLESLPETAEGIGSLDPDHHKKTQTPSDCMIAEEVRCVHLMNLISEHQFFDIDLLQVDVEGYDGEIIRMIDFDVVQPTIIKYEHESLGDQEQRLVGQLLCSQGYECFTQRGDTIAVQAGKDLSSHLAT